MSWAVDDRQYVSLCDGAGLVDPLNRYYNSRMLTIEGEASHAKFRDVDSYPMLGAPKPLSEEANYYGFGTLAVGGVLYQFLSTFNRVAGSSRPKEACSGNGLRFVGVKLIYSPDSGRTWHNQDGSTPVVWEGFGTRSRDTLLFFEEDQEAFSLLSVLQMGKGYQQNRDGYVYVYAPNGNTEGTMNQLAMFRAPKERLLDRRSYEYFAGRDSNAKARWTKDILARAVVHTFPSGWVNSLDHPYAWQPSVSYNAALGLYMMVNWATGAASDGSWFSKPSYLGHWIGTNPWGPWEQIHEEVAWMPKGDVSARAYQAQIAPKWIAPDGKSFWLVWSDFQVRDRQVFEQYKRRFQEKYWSGRVLNEDWAEYATMSRVHRPFYGFNVQRVDIL
jgi:hypothetical protein